MQKEVNLSQIQRDEPAVLIADVENAESGMILLKEEAVVPKLKMKIEE